MELEVKHQYASPTKLYEWLSARNANGPYTFVLSRPHSPWLSEFQPYEWMIESPSKYRGQVVQKRPYDFHKRILFQGE